MLIVDNLVTGLGGASDYGEITVTPGTNRHEDIDVSAVFENGIEFGNFDQKNASIEVGSGHIHLGNQWIGPLWIASSVFATSAGGTGQTYVDVDAVADVVTITWDQVSPRFELADSFSFQLQLKDIGSGQVEIVFRYGEIDTSRTYADSIRIDPLGTSNGITLTTLEAGDLEDFNTILGNTGDAGVWSYTYKLTPNNGTSGDDVLNGSSGDDRILADAGNDIVNGLGGNDELSGQSGDDTLNGGTGDDVLNGGQGSDALNGGSGTDTASYASAGAGVTANLRDESVNTGSAAGDVYSNIENLIGTKFEDELTGDNGDNQIEGGRGKDVIFGGNGDDRLLGGNGNDQINGGRGFDYIDGGSGFDILSYAGQNAGVRVTLGAMGDAATGEESVFGIERVIGTGSRDKLRAGDSLDVILEGALGNDVLRGGAGDDTLRGGDGDDLLFGKSGNDVLHGGAGADVFHFSSSVPNPQSPGADRVLDFDVTEDSLVFRLNHLPQITGFTGTAQDLYDTYAIIGNNGIELVFDTDNSIELVGVTDLAAAIAATSFL